MAFVIVTCKAKDAVKAKAMINLDHVFSFLEVPNQNKTMIDIAEGTIEIEESIDEICKNAFTFES